MSLVPRPPVTTRGFSEKLLPSNFSVFVCRLTSEVGRLLPSEPTSLRGECNCDTTGCNERLLASLRGSVGGGPFPAWPTLSRADVAWLEPKRGISWSFVEFCGISRDVVKFCGLCFWGAIFCVKRRFCRQKNRGISWIFFCKFGPGAFFGPRKSFFFFFSDQTWNFVEFHWISRNFVRFRVWSKNAELCGIDLKIFKISGPQNHVEHISCNCGGGVHFATLLGSDNSYTTPWNYHL